MSATVFTLVLLAALMHASWNALIRTTADRFASVTLLALWQGAYALASLPFVPVPSRASWPYLAGAALLHTGYKLFLIRAYAHGELSQIYPLARGAAPLLVAAASLLVFSEQLTSAALLSVLAIGLGVILMAGGGAMQRLPARAFGYAMGTAAFTASYTLADAAGARMAGSALGFAMWMFVIDGIAMLACGLLARGTAMMATLRPALATGTTAGALSLASYGIVIWAFTQAPVALVAALRETSVLFAMIIAAVALREQIPKRRCAAVALIAAGLIAMRL